MVAWISVTVGGEMFRMYLDGRSSGTVGLGGGIRKMEKSRRTPKFLV